MYNSLKYAKILEDAGLPRNQAETHIQIISEVLEEELVTRQDIVNLETRIDSKLDRMEYRLLVKLGSLMTFLFGAALGILSFIN